MWNAMGLLEGVGPLELERLQSFLNDHVMDHFLFEEAVVFPALLARDPGAATQTLIAKLHRDHVDILGATSRLMSGLAWCVASKDTEEHVRAWRGQARALIDAILVHAAHEDAHLLPLVHEHRAAIAARMPTAATGRHQLRA
jgi:iron-sulfur cluster repair protein YtfE (RIC family)